MGWKVFERALLEYNKAEVDYILQRYLEDEEATNFIDAYIVKSLTSIGEKWEKGEVALSQVYMSSRLCEGIVEKILSEKKLPLKKSPPMAIMTLEDYHTLGKRIVSAVVRSSGYKLLDYGSIIDPEEVCKKVEDDGIKILIISALMYPSALKIKKVARLLHERYPDLKILVGGAPFLMDTALWHDIGADGMGHSAPSSVEIINHWLEEAF